ncbi:MAG: PAS domain-containing sensor histidine kinase [Actinomycetota bacterium]|nr:PAS domain-containing sensor histidine kinase [Actinomycetota bacterium]
MASVIERVHRVSNLKGAQAEHIRSLCSSWQVLADLSFSDLMLYIAVDPDTFEVCAQLRPLTSQTLYPADMVGARVTQPEQPTIERAFREGRVWAQEEPVYVNGVPIQMDAVPVRHKGEVIAVLAKEGSPATSRRPGQLEEVYLRAGERVSTMICEGAFPYAAVPMGEWPRVGEGLFVLDEHGRIEWASPNALSSLHRLGFKHNVSGLFLDDLGLGATPVQHSLSSSTLLDGELSNGEVHVMLRVMPLLDGASVIGGLALARDVSEVRRHERLISVKDATIREIHHRVKNNLQTIASLLRLQGRRVSSDEAKEALKESVVRIGSIALVHETLSEAHSEVADFGEIVRRITHMISESLVMPDSDIEFKVTGATGSLPAEIATPLAVATTELLHNSVEHAFEERSGGTVGVELDRDRDRVVVVVWDDGVGFAHDSMQTTSLGLQIVRSLVGELDGRFEIVVDGGTRAEISVPLSPQGLLT